MKPEDWDELRDYGFIPYCELVRWKLRAFVAWAIVLGFSVYIFAR